MQSAAVEQALGVGRQELHGEVNAVEVAAGNRQVVGDRRTRGQEQRVDLAEHLGDGHRAVRTVADVRVGDEFDAFSTHHLDAPLDHALVEFHVGDAQGTPPLLAAKLANQELVDQLRARNLSGRSDSLGRAKN